MYLTPLEMLIYHRLKQLGYDVDYFIYDETNTANEVITKKVIENYGKEKFWRQSVANAKNWLTSANIPFQFINRNSEIDSLIKPLKGDLKEILTFTYDGINFGDIIKGVLYRYFKSLHFPDETHTIALEFLRTAITNYLQVKKLNSKNKYLSIYFSHGIYCTWEPVVEYCKKNDLRYICYDRAKLNGCANFNINQPSPDWSFNDAWTRYAHRKLSQNEEQLVTKYLQERELQKGDVFSYNKSTKVSDINALKLKLGIPEGKKVVTIFTNLIWDAANVSRDIAFTSALDCITKTIKKYDSNNSVHVVIRSHPAEVVLGTSERYGSLVREAFNQELPSNVTIIEPEMDVNSFSVIDLSDIGVVNTSTVGIEFAMLGKPIILISETNYRNKGFTFDAKDGKHYFELLDGLINRPTLMPEQQDFARKYFYMMMFLYQQKTPIEHIGIDFNKYSYDKFIDIPEVDPIFQIVKNSLDPSLKDFIQWN